jgi:hypothetical protein
MPDKPKPTPEQARQERLAAALRANLKRRKEDKRAREQPAATVPPERPKPAGNPD